MPLRYVRYWNVPTIILEKLIALATLVAVIIYCAVSAGVLWEMDWSTTETFYEFINRALVAIIGLELVRMLVNHSIGAVLELLAFVIARKLLKPDLEALDIALGTAAFVALMAARHYLMEKKFYDERDED